MGRPRRLKSTTSVNVFVISVFSVVQQDVVQRVEIRYVRIVCLRRRFGGLLIVTLARIFVELFKHIYILVLFSYLLFGGVVV